MLVEPRLTAWRPAVEDREAWDDRAEGLVSEAPVGMWADSIHTHGQRYGGLTGRAAAHRAQSIAMTVGVGPMLPEEAGAGGVH
jgi:hypothetical protein